MKSIVAKNVRTDAVAMALDMCIDGKTKDSVLGKTTIAVSDFAKLQGNDTTRKWLDYVTMLFKEGNPENKVDAKLSDFLKKKSGNDYKGFLNGLWQRFGNKDEFLMFFPNFRIEARTGVDDSIAGFECTLGEDAKALRRLANAMSDFSQLKMDNSTSRTCTSLMQQFQQGKVSVKDFEKSVSDMASKATFLLDTKIDEMSMEIWGRFDDSNVFLKDGSYTCYRLDDKDKDDFIVVADHTKWCVSHPNNTFWEQYGAPYYMITEGDHIPTALLNMSEKYEGGTKDDPYVQFKDEADNSIAYDRPSHKALIRFGKEIVRKAGKDASKFTKGNWRVFKEEIGEDDKPKEPNLKESLFRSRRTSAELISDVAFGYTDYDSLIVESPNCDESHLWMIAERNGRNREVIEKVLAHPKCPDRLTRKIVRALYGNDRDMTRNAYAVVLGREKVSPELIGDISKWMDENDFCSFCSNSSIGTDKIVALLSTGVATEDGLRKAVESRRDLPASAIEKYAERYDSVKILLLSMDGVSSDVISDAFKDVRTLDELLILLKNPNCTSDVFDKALSLEGLSDDDMRNVLMAIARNGNAGAEILVKGVSLTKEPSVMASLADNPNADDSVYMAILDREEFRSSYAFLGMLKRRNCSMDAIRKYVSSVKYPSFDFLKYRNDLSPEFIAEITSSSDMNPTSVVWSLSNFMEIVEAGCRLGYRNYIGIAATHSDHSILKGIEPDKDFIHKVSKVISDGDCPREFIHKAFGNDACDQAMYAVKNAISRNVAPRHYYEEIAEHLMDASNDSLRGENLKNVCISDGCPSDIRMKIYKWMKEKNYRDVIGEILGSRNCTQEILDDCLSDENFASCAVGNPNCPKSVVDRAFEKGSYTSASIVSDSEFCTDELVERAIKADVANRMYPQYCSYMKCAGVSKECIDRLKKCHDWEQEELDALDFKFLANPNCTDDYARGILGRFPELGESESCKDDEFFEVLLGMVPNERISDGTLAEFAKIGNDMYSYHKEEVGEALAKSKRMLRDSGIEIVRNDKDVIDDGFFSNLFCRSDMEPERRAEAYKKIGCSRRACFDSLLKRLPRGEAVRIAVALEGKISFRNVPWKEQQDFLKEAIEVFKSRGLDTISLEGYLAQPAQEPVESQRLEVPTGSTAGVILETTSNRKIINSTIATGTRDELAKLMRNRNVTRGMARKFAEKSNETADGYYRRFGLDDFLLNSVRFFDVFRNHGADFSEEELERIRDLGDGDVKWLADKFIDYLYNKEHGMYVERQASVKFRNVSRRLVASLIACSVATGIIDGLEEY